MELYKLVVDCKNAITQLINHIHYNDIDFPFEISLDEIREWFLVAQGYAECMEKHRLAH